MRQSSPVLDLLPGWLQCLPSQFVEPHKPRHLIWTELAGLVVGGQEEAHVTVSPHYLCPGLLQLQLAPPTPPVSPPPPPDQPPQPRPQALAEVHQCTRPDKGEGATVKIPPAPATGYKLLLNYHLCISALSSQPACS